MSAATLTQTTATGRRVSLRPEAGTVLVGACERTYPFAMDLRHTQTWSPKHNLITGAPAGPTESPPTG